MPFCMIFKVYKPTRTTRTLSKIIEDIQPSFVLFKRVINKALKCVIIITEPRKTDFLL